jgi:TonB family protein
LEIEMKGTRKNVMKLINYRKTLLLLTTMALICAAAVAQDPDMKVSRGDAMKAATSKMSPIYPTMARQLHLEGDVEVEAHITEAGTVESVKPLTGNAVLMMAAVDAMKHWKFTPFTEGGKPVKAIAPILFTFKL